MPQRRIATVLMLDVVGSTHVAAQLGDARYRELSSRFNRIVRAALKRFGGKEEDNAGDGFFATFSQPDRAIRCAVTIAEEVRTLGVEVRSGIHTGQTEDQAGKTHGIAVVIGARVMSLAHAGEILVTSTTKELVTGSGFGFEDFSAHELKGVPGTWQVFAVTGVEDKQRARPLPAAEAAERLRTVQPATGRERPRPNTLIAMGTALLLVIGTIVFAVTREEPEAPSRSRSNRPASGSVLQIDLDTGKTLDSISGADSAAPPPGFVPPVPSHPMVVGQGGVWVLRFRGLLINADPLSHEVRRSIRLEVGAPTAAFNLAEGFDSVWASFGEGLIRVNPATGEHGVFARITRGGAVAGLPTDVAVGGGRIWMGRADGTLVRLDPTSRGETVSVEGLAPIDGIDYGHGAVWTLDVLGGTVTRYDPETMRVVAAIPVAGGVDSIVSGERGLWVLSRSLGSLTEIDVSENTTGPIVQVGEAPTGLAAGLGAVWVGDKDGLIRRVDEDTREMKEFPFGAEIRAIAFDDDTNTIWVDVA